MTVALERACPSLASWGRGLRPVGEVIAFGVLFLLTSLVVAFPISLFVGRKVLGIWYILPFTLAFLALYQRCRHRQGLRHLGLVRQRWWGFVLVAGFAGSGVLVLTYSSVQSGVGWMAVGGVHPLASDPWIAAAGLGLALAANLALGLGEELIFRGYVLRRLSLGYRSRWVAVCGSSLAYSAVHAPSGRGALVLFNLFLLGLVLALAVVITRALWLSIGVHAGWNFWLDGICIYDPSRMERSRLLQIEYHLAGDGDLTLFKLTVSLVLVLAVLALAVHLHRHAAPPPRGDSR